MSEPDPRSLGGAFSTIPQMITRSFRTLSEWIFPVKEKAPRTRGWYLSDTGEFVPVHLFSLDLLKGRELDEEITFVWPKDGAFVGDLWQFHDPDSKDAKVLTIDGCIASSILSIHDALTTNEARAKLYEDLYTSANSFLAVALVADGVMAVTMAEARQQTIH